jgi:cobalt transporter subunit CbtB
MFREGWMPVLTCEPGDLLGTPNAKAIGCDGRRYKMTTQTLTATQSKSLVAAAALSMLLGAAIVIFSGHVQASTLHSSAHDTRHANGFPCH